jgi:hypothetical protein
MQRNLFVLGGFNSLRFEEKSEHRRRILEAFLNASALSSIICRFIGVLIFPFN